MGEGITVRLFWNLSGREAAVLQRCLFFIFFLLFTLFRVEILARKRIVCSRSEIASAAQER